MFLVFSLFACTDPVGQLPKPEHGTQQICLGGPEDVGGADELDLLVTGTVVGFDVGNDMNLADCLDGPSTVVEIEDADGEVWSLGWSIADDRGQDLTPVLSLEAGSEVDLLFRWKMVWGTTAGFVLSDAEGLVASGDEGAWGSALSADDLMGFEVERGANIVSREETQCQPIEGYTVDFVSLARTTSLLPVNSGPFEIDGQMFEAMAIDAMDYGESRSCSVSDRTNVTAWAVYR